MPRLILFACTAAAVALTACGTPRAPSPAVQAAAVPPLPTLDPQQQRGRDFALRRCGGCHTVGLDDGGAQEGPAFYKLARRYNAISLERRFSEVSAHGFDRMPAIPFTASEAADLVAYFDTLQGN
jgi:mono/diheme cytochrome c family protein